MDADRVALRRHRSAGRRSLRRVLLVSACIATIWRAVLAAGAGQAAGAAATAGLSCAEMESFLRTAKIGTRRELSVGITAPKRATLSDGTLQHDASIQVVDESKTSFQTPRGTELNFRDSWKFNVAGYELAKMLQLNMVPPYVERSVSGLPASLSWWISDAMMERDRFQKKLEPPDVDRWNNEMYAVRVFHQLIHDNDPNFTNLLITKDWRIWMIDFTRAFRVHKSLQNTKDLVRSDRKLLANLRQLTPDMLREKLGKWLMKAELEAVAARRDLIVKFFDNEVAKKGEAAVLYDLPRVAEPCGAGL